MIVQIYSLTDADDVRACVEAGVDHLGFAPGDQDVPANVSLGTYRDLVAAVPDGADVQTSVLSVHTEVDDVVALADATDPDILHVCSDTHVLGVAELRAVADRISDDVALMKAVDVVGPESVEAAAELAPACDWLLLDTATDEVQGVGASGTTHDWSVSARVVESVDTPVVLAGGLGPGNVADAVREVRPAGVDSYTHTSRTADRKDRDAVRAFVENARAAAREHGLD